MNFDEQDRQLRSPVARASSPCFRQAGSLSYHFLVGSRITEFGRQNSLGILLAWGQWLAALFDATENVALLVMLRGTVEKPWPQIAMWCSTSKFVLIGIGLVYAAFGGVRWLTAFVAAR